MGSRTLQIDNKYLWLEFLFHSSLLYYPLKTIVEVSVPCGIPSKRSNKSLGTTVEQSPRKPMFSRPGRRSSAKMASSHNPEYYPREHYDSQIAINSILRSPTSSSPEPTSDRLSGIDSIQTRIS